MFFWLPWHSRSIGGFTLEQVIDLSPLGGTGGTLEEVEGLGFPAMVSIEAADPSIGIEPFVYAAGVQVQEDLIVSLVAFFNVAPGSPGTRRWSSWPGSPPSWRRTSETTWRRTTLS